MRFRRSQPDPAGVTAAESEAEAVQGAGEAGTTAPSSLDERRHDGPWDSSEVSIDEDDKTKIDLGGLIVTGKPGLELRLQVDEPTQQVVAALLLDAEGALELRPFAAPRNADIWDEIRQQIGAETARRGGTATDVDGEYGTELQVVMPITTPEGKPATQPSRVVGVRGPRWLLRATFLGRPALEPDPEGAVETALREVIVVRGGDPMPPGEPLPLVMPAGAQPIRSSGQPSAQPSGQPGQPPS